MILKFDDLGQNAVRRQPGELQPGCSRLLAVVDVDLVTMAVAFAIRVMP